VIFVLHLYLFVMFVRCRYYYSGGTKVCVCTVVRCIEVKSSPVEPLFIPFLCGYVLEPMDKRYALHRVRYHSTRLVLS
jgi:hypothetical protein